MTHTVAVTSNAQATAETPRARAARATGTSYAQVQAAAVKTSDTKDTSSSKSSASSAPKGERTQKVEGHNYVEIVSGPRNGMFINNTGSTRDGEAFLIVKRHGREFHIYGSGEDRKVFEVGRKREASDGNGTTGAPVSTGTSGASGTSAT
jgi:hypothetical protein